MNNDPSDAVSRGDEPINPDLIEAKQWLEDYHPSEDCAWVILAAGDWVFRDSFGESGADIAPYLRRLADALEPLTTGQQVALRSLLMSRHRHSK